MTCRVRLGEDVLLCSSVASAEGLAAYMREVTFIGSLCCSSIAVGSISGAVLCDIRSLQLPQQAAAAWASWLIALSAAECFGKVAQQTGNIVQGGVGHLFGCVS